MTESQGQYLEIQEKDPTKDRGKVLNPEIDRGKDRGKVLTPKIAKKIDRYKVFRTGFL